VGVGVGGVGWGWGGVKIVIVFQVLSHVFFLYKLVYYYTCIVSTGLRKDRTQKSYFCFGSSSFELALAKNMEFLKFWGVF
jgi:hypothetical protein